MHLLLTISENKNRMTRDHVDPPSQREATDRQCPARAPVCRSWWTLGSTLVVASPSVSVTVRGSRNGAGCGAGTAETATERG